MPFLKREAMSLKHITYYRIRYSYRFSLVNYSQKLCINNGSLCIVYQKRKKRKKRVCRERGKVRTLLSLTYIPKLPFLSTRKGLSLNSE